MHNLRGPASFQDSPLVCCCPIHSHTLSSLIMLCSLANCKSYLFGTLFAQLKKYVDYHTTHDLILYSPRRTSIQKNDLFSLPSHSMLHLHFACSLQSKIQLQKTPSSLSRAPLCKCATVTALWWLGIHAGICLAKSGKRLSSFCHADPLQWNLWRTPQRLS